MALTLFEIQSTIQEWLKELRSSGEAELDHYSGKRKEPRFHPWSEPIEIRVGKDVAVGRGVNLSRTGIGFVCKVQIARGSVVEVRRTGDETWIPVRVQHCTQSVGSYKVGGTFVSK